MFTTTTAVDQAQILSFFLNKSMKYYTQCTTLEYKSFIFWEGLVFWTGIGQKYCYKKAILIWVYQALGPNGKHPRQAGAGFFLARLQAHRFLQTSDWSATLSLYPLVNSVCINVYE